LTGGLPRRRLGGGRAATARAWRAQKRPGEKRSRGGEGRGRRVDGVAAGGGAREAVPAVDGGDRSRAEGGSGAVRGGRNRLESEGLVCESQKVQGPLCKLKFSHCYKGQMEKCST
jgi:hypothetical protein